ncbi:YibE/F family protein [Candidatus Shapirobacteria bacterium CG09_land_8_20_14_0_10_49_15]|uniref:YibE/F family protein n=2 Tax=Candidatus Shapironibacteriota TaxID=1752721 RepID=A0A2M8L7U3_9BACT|nr:MAG: YibE/F family protein [Candidatus Shapirobacteria bacterium CG09_land_8_20_14_0_10_49_15]PJE70304.1 MAG: YibE/F family protein [Candidatus Shapirobacteria bacterium CG10_big_fil_rev_8_21_14_0_10_48_15]
MVKKILLIIILALVYALPPLALAQEEILEGQVTQIVKEDVVVQADQKSLYQQLGILITHGSAKDKRITLKAAGLPLSGAGKYQVGDQVMLSLNYGLAGEEIYNLVELVRRKQLLTLFLIFIVLVIAVGRWRGVASLAGLGLSFLVIFKLILPQINQGKDPVRVAILASLLLIPLTFCLSHGWNKKTLVAMVGTLGALVLTGLLAKYFIDGMRLMGFASEEAGFLKASRSDFNIRGLILAGIIIGALGVLDDITVAQAAVVQQLKQSNAKLRPREVFWRAMKVGQDHIASMVNTLVLVYTGAALPLLLLFISNPLPFSQVINYEIIAEEVIRTLAGSIGLVAAVPLTTFLASQVDLRN